MAGPPSRSELHDWHELLEHYSPDGTLGRVLFGLLVGGGLGSLLFFGGFAQVAGPLSPFLLSELVGVVSIPVGAAVMAISLVVLWPVYLWLIGNVDSPATYGGSGNSHTDRSARSPQPNPHSSEATQIEVLEGLYATGDISQETFERRLDEIVDDGSQEVISNRKRAKTGTESEVE